MPSDDPGGGDDVNEGGGRGGSSEREEPSGHEIPLDGDVLLYTGATASVAPERLAPLLRDAQAHLGPRRDTYRRTYERVFAEEERDVFLVPEGHWTDVGDALDLPEREVDALRRAHAQQLRRLGASADRRSELETALEIREAVVIGR
ncbi:hypothetical protein [Halobellus captivus]|uniref:hypothetical protein n=1 Tax=Halobellus captivus TaxID=2592614 RepID=UPI001EF00A50|nr:hypothetical protein [Halobellus captivus]